MHILNLLQTALFVALLIISSYIVIPIGPVPHTLQPLVVLLAGYLLGSRYGALSIGVWLVLGAIGLPVFNQGQGSFAVLMGPTGGFLLAFIPSAYLAGRVDVSSRGSFIATVGKFLFIVLIMYGIGSVGFRFNMEFFLNKNVPWQKTFYLCVAPFLPFDIIKALCAAYVGRKVKAALIAAGLKR